MLNDYIKNAIKSQASYVEYGYGQVEPNHLSAQKTGEIYAQLPAASTIKVLEQGQFVKYDYSKRDSENNTVGEVNFTGNGEWMLVYNEIKLYEGEPDCAFAMVKDNYRARVYSPGGVAGKTTHSRYWGGKDDKEQPIEKVTAPGSLYNVTATEDPFLIEIGYAPTAMPKDTSMVPRVFKTHIGDIFTTNMINETEVNVGDTLSPGAADGILSSSGDGTMEWEVVKVYTMPDGQKGVKVMRIK